MSKEKHEIAVTARTETGSGAARRARKKGLVPGIVYSRNGESRQVYVNAGDWASLYRLNPHLVYLKDGDQSQPALVKEVQINHLKAYFYHVDFQAVSADEKVHSTLSLVPFGESVGVNAGGVLEQLVHELEIIGRADSLVDSLRVDVSGLAIGHRLTVGDLALPDGIAAKLDPEVVIFSVVAPSEDAKAAEASAEEPEAIKQKKPEADAKAKA